MIIKKKTYEEIVKENESLKTRVYKLDKENQQNVEELKKERFIKRKILNEFNKQNYNSTFNLINKIKSIIAEQ